MTQFLQMKSTQISTPDQQIKITNFVKTNEQTSSNKIAENVEMEEANLS